MASQSELEILTQRIAKLEAAQAQQKELAAETERRYGSLKAMMLEVTQNASNASVRAELASKKALLASTQAGLAAKTAAEVGALSVADTALTAAHAAADAAGDAAAAAAEAWKSALLAAGHTAESQLMQMSIRAGDASQSAAAAAIKALKVFTEAYEAVKRVALSKS